MWAKSSAAAVQAAPAQTTSEETRAEDLFNRQKAYFASDAMKGVRRCLYLIHWPQRMLKQRLPL